MMSAMGFILRKNTSLQGLTPDHLHREVGLVLTDSCRNLQRLALCHRHLERKISTSLFLRAAATNMPLLPELMLRFSRHARRVLKMQTLLITLLTKEDAFRHLEVLHLAGTFGCPFTRDTAAFLPSLHTLALRNHQPQHGVTACCFELAYFLPALPALRVLQLSVEDDEASESAGMCFNWDQDPNITRITLPHLEELAMDRCCSKLRVPALRKLVGCTIDR